MRYFVNRAPNVWLLREVYLCRAVSETLPPCLNNAPSAVSHCLTTGPAHELHSLTTHFLGSQHDAARICCRAQAASLPAIDRHLLQAQQQTFQPPLLLSNDGTDGRTPDRYIAYALLGALCGQQGRLRHINDGANAP